MRKKKPLSTAAVVLTGFISLLAVSAVAFSLSLPGNTSSPAQWFQVNFFPADQFGATSLMDTSGGIVESQEYKGSTSTAWMLSLMIALIAFLGSFLFFAKERKMI